MIWLALGAFLYALCGFLAYGAYVADMWGTSPGPLEEWQELFAIFLALTGPFGLFLAAMATEAFSGRPFRHGFMWRAR